MSNPICSSCGSENTLKAKFCDNCGTSLSKDSSSENETGRSRNRENRRKNKGLDSVAPIIGVILCLLFFDVWPDGEIEWAPWAVVPLAVFGIFVPLLNKIINS